MTDQYDDYIGKSRAYYDERFSTKHRAGKRPRAEERMRWRFIEPAVASRAATAGQPLEILDFGCGNGWMSHLLSAYGQVTGVDLSAAAIEKAREAYPDVEFIHVDASEDVSGVLNRTFDLVVSSEVIEHLLKQEEYLQNVVRLLKPGGKLVLTTPNGRWKDPYFYGPRKAWAQPYERWLTADGLKALTAGLLRDTVVTTFHGGWVFDMPSYGRLRLIGHPLFRMSLKALGCKAAFIRYLEKKGFGIYLLLEGFRK